ncbi:MAG: bifunctional precorrin-2 dehydrogenase/sirohydrochlorin ferrochelatase [Firmicutes bacterium]|nr:bifunctional precorrin-2 dehydrogenase/sirohydrochlorin ferrochelatase [Bacillota bacterium]
MAHLYPIYLNLAGRNCLVVGGGKVAERKAATLLEYGAHIRLVSPSVTSSISDWAAQNLIELRARMFKPEDLEGVFLVFIATDDPEINNAITMLCQEKAILVNAVDDPPNCDFYVPSILRRNSLCVAISTEGKSPLLAAKLRRELEEYIPEEYGEWVEILGELRTQIKETDLNIGERKAIFEGLVNSNLLDLLIEGRKEQIEERIKQCMSCLQE